MSDSYVLKQQHSVVILLFCLFFCLLPRIAVASNLSSVDNLPVLQPVLQLTEGLNQPTAIDIDSNGQLYVLNGVNGQVVVYSAAGSPLFRFARAGTAAGELNMPMALRVSGNDVIVADSGNHRFSVFDQQGNFLRVIHPALPAAEGQDTAAQAPVPVALHIANGILTWSDRRHHRLCQQWLDTGKLIGCQSEYGEQPGQFRYPFQIAQDPDGYLNVVDILNGRIQVYHRTAGYKYQLSRFGTAPGELYRPNAVAFDAHGLLYVSDAYFGSISVFSQGRFMGKLNTGINLKTPTDMRWFGDLFYVVDSQSSAIHVFKRSLRQVATLAKITPQTDVVASAPAISQKNCISCHLSWDKPRSVLPGGLDGVDSVDDADGVDGVSPVATPNMCYSCHHGAVIDSRVAIGQRQQHSTVHQSAYEAPDLTDRKDRIPEMFPLTESGELYCGSCHTPHNKQSKNEVSEYKTLHTGHKNAWLRENNNSNQLCEQCHKSKANTQPSTSNSVEKAPSQVNHPLSIRLAEGSMSGYETTDIKSLENGLPATLIEHGAMLGNNSELVCQSCHQIHGGFETSLLTAASGNSELCVSCHEQQSSKDLDDARHKGIHPANFTLEDPLKFLGAEIKQVTCQTCHQVHDGRPDTPLLPSVIKTTEALCESCHDRQHAATPEAARHKGVHPVGIELDDTVTIAGINVESIGCLSCHSVHNGQPDTPALLETARDGQLCANCHKQQGMVVNSDHDLRFSAPSSQNHLQQTPEASGVCGSCHSLHQAGKESRFLSVVREVSGDKDNASLTTDRYCLNCHQNRGIAEVKSISRYQHPYKDLILRSDAKVMPLVNDLEDVDAVERDDEVQNRFEFGKIACTTCHDVHQWQPNQKTPLQPIAAVSEPTGPSELTAQSPQFADDKSRSREGNSHNSFLRHKGVGNTFCVDCHGIDALVKYRLYHDKKVERPDIDYIK